MGGVDERWSTITMFNGINNVANVKTTGNFEISLSLASQFLSCEEAGVGVFAVLLLK